MNACYEINRKIYDMIIYNQEIRVSLKQISQNHEFNAIQLISILIS